MRIAGLADRVGHVVARHAGPERAQGVAAVGDAHCSNTLCTFGTSVTSDDVADAVGESPAILIGLDGMPIIAHRNASNAALRVTHCSNVFCTPFYRAN